MRISDWSSDLCSSDLAMRHLRIGTGGEPGVHRAALIRFHMAEADPAQPLDRHDPRDRRGHRIEHAPGAAVEQQRLLRLHQELVEGEAGGRRDLRHKGGEPIDPLRDFSNVGAHAETPSSASRLAPYPLLGWRMMQWGEMPVFTR